ncbi:glycosyltransferase family 2 protein [Fulvivirgaceae bacterium LMO-SS25]
MSSSISIIIPCYNQGHFLTECVESVLSQDFNDWEMLIVNDGSTDDTLKLALDFASKDKRINVIDKENGGLSSARNTGIKQAKGKYIHFLDSDDFVLKGFYSAMIDSFNDTESVDVILSGYQYYSLDRGFFQIVEGKEKSYDLQDFLNGNIAPPVAFCLKTELIQSIGNFDESLKSAEDWDFWLRVLKAGGKVKGLRKALVAYRYSKDSMSRNAFRMYEALKTVAQRAVKKDSRILIETEQNRDYNFDYKFVIKNSLLQCLGVSLMQGKVEESSALFRKETAEYSFAFQAKDFAIMCSYLSFRYWYSREDIKRVFNEIYPSFSLFLDQNPIDGLSKSSILSTIFERHRKQYNVQKFGFIGSIINKFLY